MWITLSCFGPPLDSPVLAIFLAPGVLFIFTGSSLLDALLFSCLGRDTALWLLTLSHLSATLLLSLPRARPLLLCLLA